MLHTDLDDHRKKRPPLFWWLLANILAIAFAITAWVVCLNLFRDPTNPTSYKLMSKVGRLDPLESFTAKTVPNPRNNKTAQELELQFKSYGESDLETLNHELRRSYLTNYNKAKFLTYLHGEFRIIGVRELSQDDFIRSGVIVKAQALVRPDPVADPIPYPVFIECFFPSEEDTTESFSVGKILMLKKQRDCAAIINVGTTDFEDRTVLFLSLIRLKSGNYKPDSGTAFKITAPGMVNLESPLPAFP